MVFKGHKKEAPVTLIVVAITNSHTDFGIPIISHSIYYLRYFNIFRDAKQ
jgi:hypothetical protein